MGIYHFLIAFSIVIPFFALMISIPSIISIFKIGRSDYFRNIKLLYRLPKKLNLCYKLDSRISYNINGRIHNRKDKDYYFPIYVNDENVFIVNKSDKGLWYNLRINDAKYDGENWKTDLIEIRTTTCMFTQILNDRFQKKLDNLVESSVMLEDIENLNQLINSEIVSIRRESKLNQIIN
jgi:hypothetical protein